LPRLLRFLFGALGAQLDCFVASLLAMTWGALRPRFCFRAHWTSIGLSQGLSDFLFSDFQKK
jgi:hypothetical protein